MSDTDPWLPETPHRLLVADPALPRPVWFEATATDWPPTSTARRGARPASRPPGIVMTGPVSSVKEQTLPHYAERFAAAGYTVLAFDPRGFGESDGEPRFHYDPWLIVSDYVNAAAYLVARDASTPSGWPRSACAWAVGTPVAPPRASDGSPLARAWPVAYDIGGTFQRVMGPEGLAAYLRAVNELPRPRAPHRRDGVRADDRQGAER